MIELFPSPQLRLRAVPPILAGVVAIAVFLIRVPSASPFLSSLAALGLVGVLEGTYLLILSRRPTVVLDTDGISVWSRLPFGRVRRVRWGELLGGQAVRGQTIVLTTADRPFRIWRELVAGGPTAFFSALYEMELRRQGIHGSNEDRPADRMAD